MKSSLVSFKSIHLDDLPSLEQAVWVAEQNEFDMVFIGTWAVNENKIEKFGVFRSRLEM